MAFGIIDGDIGLY